MDKLIWYGKDINGKHYLEAQVASLRLTIVARGGGECQRVYDVDLHHKNGLSIHVARREDLTEAKEAAYGAMLEGLMKRQSELRSELKDIERFLGK